MKNFTNNNSKKNGDDKNNKTRPFVKCKNCGAKLTKKDQKNGFCWTCSL